MHDTSTYFYQGWWYGRCTCGWTSGPYTIEGGATHAGWNHEKANQN